MLGLSRTRARAALTGLVGKAVRWSSGLQVFLLRRLGLIGRYQPDPFRPLDSQGAVRDCADRFNALSRWLPEGPLSALDFGCHSGYFTFRMAERGGLCIGIDRGEAEILTARSLATLHGVRNAAFVRMDLSPANTGGLPSADVVFCLSIFHHWVRQYGQDGALALLRALAGRATGYFVFETGQPEEADMLWADQLAFVGNDVVPWANRTLQNLGFATVHYAGTHPSGVSKADRHLFVAVR